MTKRTWKPTKSSAYATVEIPQNDPSYMRYWKKKFSKMDIWFDFNAWVATVHHHLPAIMEQAEVGAKEAMDIAWFEAMKAYTGEEDSILWGDYCKFLKTQPDEEICLFLAHYCIGFDIMFGKSERQAVKEYKEWMKEDIENPIYCDVALTLDFKVVTADDYLDNHWVPPKKKAKTKK